MVRKDEVCGMFTSRVPAAALFTRVQWFWRGCQISGYPVVCVALYT